MTDALRRSALLAQCSDAQLASVLRQSDEIRLEPGDVLYDDADRVQDVWVVLDGELLLAKTNGRDEAIVDQLRSGALVGEISLLSGSPTEHRALTQEGARLLRIPGDVFHSLIRSCAPVMEAVLRGMAERVQRTERLLVERERMAGLGTLAAGLSHELKNPASAAHRGLALLGEEFSALEPLARRLAEHPWSPGEVALLRRLEEATLAIDQASRELDAVTRADREERLTAWLEEHSVEGIADLAPLLADRGITTEQLDGLATGCDESIVADALAWTRHMATIRQLLAEAMQSTSRISEMVRAVKAYSYVDTTELRTADVHDGVEIGLTMLGHKLRESRAAVVREYDRTLPPVPSYGTELGQLWVNILDNAADAVAAGGGGTVRVRTYRDGDQAVVEISDTGGGIAPEVRGKIFDPFFTTKGVGKGTGLGLEIVKRIVARHGGTIAVASDAGSTRFTVRLPLQNDGGGAGGGGGGGGGAVGGVVGARGRAVGS